MNYDLTNPVERWSYIITYTSSKPVEHRSEFVQQYHGSLNTIADWSVGLSKGTTAISFG